jgi:hypothetical protein
MILKESIFLVSLISVLAAQSSPPSPTENYPFKKELDSNYILYWKTQNDVITFEVHAKTSGWLSFGVGMSKNSLIDSIVGWVSGQTVGHFSDRHKNDFNNELIIDTKQDWLPLNAKLENGYTIFKFERPIMICDPNAEDVNIYKDTKVFFAYGNNISNDRILDFKDFTMFNGPIDLLSGTNERQCRPIIEVKPKATLDVTPSMSYTNEAELVEGAVNFYWTTDDTDLFGEIYFKTTGWVAFGLSPNGGMPMSDVFVAWINGDKKEFTVIKQFDN